MTNNKQVLKFVNDAVELCQPEKVVWITGEEAQLEELRKEALSTGELIKLNDEKLPGCYLHRSDVNDVARVEGRTFICCKNKEDAGPINNWMDPQEAYSKVGAIFDGSMKGKTMYVIPYSMGAVGSTFSKVGIEVTDSIYVVVSMKIMTRIGKAVLDVLVRSVFVAYHRRVVSGIGITNESGVQVQNSHPGGDEHAGLIVFTELGIDLCEYIIHR